MSAVRACRAGRRACQIHLRSVSAMRAGYRLLLILAGCCVLAIVLSPPLHELSERWFSVHMVEHELLMAVAAPLIVLGRPLWVLLSALPQPARRRVARWAAAPPIRRAWLVATGPVLAWSAHTLAQWIWSVPLLVVAALGNAMVQSL